LISPPARHTSAARTPCEPCPTGVVIGPRTFAIASGFRYLDRPVSNSGKLAALLRTACEQKGLAASVELTDDVDRRVSAADVALSADSAVLDAAGHWFLEPNRQAAKNAKRRR